jgi:hypothetical protein
MTDHRPLRIFIGFDPRNVISFTACVASILARSSKPLAITPLVAQTLPIENRGEDAHLFARFLVPWLCGFEGWALYVEPSVMFVADPVELFALADEQFAVMVRDISDGLEDARADVMLLNCAHADNAKLVPEAVGNAAFSLNWSTAVGHLPTDWHHLVGYDEPNPDAKLVHFAQGVPAWPETFACEWSEEWLRMVQIANWPWALKEVEAQVPYQKTEDRGQRTEDRGQKNR